MARADDPIPLNWALAIGDAVLDALARTAWTTSGSGRLPLCLHGPDAPKNAGWNHGHAFVLPEDADADGIIDHISLTASVGLDPAAIRLLAATDRLILSSGTRIELMLDRAGSSELLAPAIKGPSRVWISRTPYLPPAKDRDRFDIKDAARQLKSEIAGRRPAAVLARQPEPLPRLDHASEPLLPEHFHLSRDNGALPPEASAPCFFRLVFSTPVAGPLAFGWGCHQGLGLFVAQE